MTRCTTLISKATIKGALTPFACCSRRYLNICDCSLTLHNATSYPPSCLTRFIRSLSLAFTPRIVSLRTSSFPLLAQLMATRGIKLFWRQTSSENIGNKSRAMVRVWLIILRYFGELGNLSSVLGTLLRTQNLAPSCKALVSGSVEFVPM